jgi:hypothetical protein
MESFMNLDIESVHPENRALVAKSVKLFSAVEKHFEKSGEQKRIVLDMSENVMWYMERKLDKSRLIANSRDEFSQRLREGLCGLFAGPYGHYPLVWDGYHFGEDQQQRIMI